MTFGYEVELFLSRDGTLLDCVPSSYPRDASQHLIEARTRPYSDPMDVEQALVEELERLKVKAARDGFTVERRAIGQLETGLEFAGFHVHFGHYGHIDMPRFIGVLDQVFASEIREARRPFSQYRMKPWGFEYRSLPATVDARAVTKVLRGLQ